MEKHEKICVKSPTTLSNFSRLTDLIYINSIKYIHVYIKDSNYRKESLKIKPTKCSKGPIISDIYILMHIIHIVYGTGKYLPLFQFYPFLPQCQQANLGLGEFQCLQISLFKQQCLCKFKMGRNHLQV